MAKILRDDDETKFTPKAPGSFQRGPNRLQGWIEAGGESPPAQGRYHIFVNYGCGWCHQVMIVRALKGLEDVVSLSHVGIKRVGKMGTPEYRGWSVSDDQTGNGFGSAFDIYNSNQDYGMSQLTIPILFDKELKRVISNDPAHILLMLNSNLNTWAENPDVDLYPNELRDEIEAVNATVFPGINDGVYRCWIGRTDEAYNEGFEGIQGALAFVEGRLQDSNYLCGDHVTLADARAFPHLFRFDVIYHDIMLRDKGPKLIERFPAIVAWLKRLFEMPCIQRFCDLEIAHRFYSNLPDADCDRQYADRKYEWMPSREELETKRQTECLPKDACCKLTT